MRIVGGTLKGRKIHAAKGDISRPTSDRTREALFNILNHRDDIDLNNARVIDLFAGSGALGFEALSRGAAWCLFVEQDSRARAAIRDNIENLDVFGKTRIHRRSATALGKIPASTGEPFTLAFLDPPYEKNLCEPCFKSLDEGGWLKKNAVLICEQKKTETPMDHKNYQHLDRRIYGNTQISFYLYTA